MPTISKFKTAAAQWIQHMVSRKILWICALEVPALKYSLFINFHNKNDWFINLKQLIHSAMSLNCFWRPSILCSPTSLWIWAQNSDTSRAASDPQSLGAQTCEFSENLPHRHASGEGEAVGSVGCYHMVCGLYGSLNAHTASLLLQGQGRSARKKNTELPHQHCGTLFIPLTANIGRSREEHRYRRLT